MATAPNLGLPHLPGRTRPESLPHESGGARSLPWEPLALDGKPESNSSFVLSFRLFTHVSLLRFYRKWGLTLGLVCMVCGISFDRCAVGHLFFLCGSNQEPIGHAGIRSPFCLSLLVKVDLSVLLASDLGSPPPSPFDFSLSSHYARAACHVREQCRHT